MDGITICWFLFSLWGGRGDYILGMWGKYGNKIFFKYGKGMNKMKIQGTKHWIFVIWGFSACCISICTKFGILGSISKWELPFLAKGHVICHRTATDRIETPKSTNKGHWKLMHHITNSLTGKISSSNFSKLNLREHILLYKSIFRI